jgi:hypothetical protein
MPGAAYVLRRKENVVLLYRPKAEPLLRTVMSCLR